MDKLDRKILKAFQLDARIKNADLARELGVAPSTMLERVRRLEERGYFSGFKAVINPEKLGLTVQAMVSVSLGQHSTKTIRPFEEAVKAIPNILICYHVTGRFDYILHVVAKNLSHPCRGWERQRRFWSFPKSKTTTAFPWMKLRKPDPGKGGKKCN
jgi:Lrp/AsnC family leucine-responsive transcriptional regulator